MPNDKGLHEVGNVRIVGGPSPHDTRIFLDDVDISGCVQGLKLNAGVSDTLNTLELQIIPWSLEVEGMSNVLLDYTVLEPTRWERIRRWFQWFWLEKQWMVAGWPR